MSHTAPRGGGAVVDGRRYAVALRGCRLCGYGVHLRRLALWYGCWGMSAAGSLALAVMTSGGGGRADLRRDGVHRGRLSLLARAAGLSCFGGRCAGNGGRGMVLRGICGGLRGGVSVGAGCGGVLLFPFFVFFFRFARRVRPLPLSFFSAHGRGGKVAGGGQAHSSSFLVCGIYGIWSPSSA